LTNTKKIELRGKRKTQERK